MKIMKKVMLDSAMGQHQNSLAAGAIDMPDFDFDFNPDPVSTDLSSSTGVSTSGNGFFSDFNLNGLLDTLLKGGMTWAQIEAAKNGKDVYVQGQNGDQKENITPILISKLESQAAAQQTTVNQMMQMMQQQMVQNASQPPKKDNTLLYVGIGTGVLVLLGGTIMLINNKKKK